MSSTSSPLKTRCEPKVLLRSASFQKLCSIPYNFKIEAIRSYKEHIKTVIKLLKVATRSYVISLYFKVVAIILLNYYAFARWNILKISYLAPTRSDNPSAYATVITTAKAGTSNSTHIVRRTPQAKHGKPITLGRLLDNPIVGFQTFLTYSCMAYVAIQVAWLVNALSWSANIPLGLVFLMLDLGYMGMIIFKIALNDTNYTA